jgi:hypothetical protein
MCVRPQSHTPVAPLNTYTFLKRHSSLRYTRSVRGADVSGRYWEYLPSLVMSVRQMQHIILHVAHSVSSPLIVMPVLERTRSFPKPFTPARQTLSHPTPLLRVATRCLRMPRVTGANAWGKPGNRKARSHRWHRRPQRPATTDDGLEDPAWSKPAFDCNEERPHASQAVIARQKLLNRARKLWADDYTTHLEFELKERPELTMSVVELYCAQMSTYRARLSDSRLIERYDLKTKISVRDTVAVLRRRRNQFDIPFSVDARSLSYFNQRVPRRVWCA